MFYLNALFVLLSFAYAIYYYIYKLKDPNDIEKHNEHLNDNAILNPNKSIEYRNKQLDDKIFKDENTNPTNKTKVTIGSENNENDIDEVYMSENDAIATEGHNIIQLAATVKKETTEGNDNLEVSNETNESDDEQNVNTKTSHGEEANIDIKSEESLDDIPRNEGEKLEIELGNVNKWKTKEVLIWLNNIVKLTKYHEIFKKNNITGESLLSLNDDILLKMGIESYGHRFEILKFISKL